MASAVSPRQTRLMASSPQKSIPSEASNSPVPLTRHFSGDELSLIFGTYLDDLIFVCDWHGGALLAGNGRFLRFVGKENDTILAEDLGLRLDRRRGSVL